MKLGKAPAQHRVSTKLFSSYVTSLDWLGAIPDVDWRAGLSESTPDFGNLTYGCCGPASVANAKMVANSAHGLATTPTTSDVLAWYAGDTGFRADDPSTDNGVVLVDLLGWMVKNGIIDAFVSVNFRDPREMAAAEYLFGGTINGAMLPVSAQLAGPWVGKTGALVGDDAPGSWGGHAMYRFKDFISWGMRKPADDQWRLDYQDEAYAVLLPEWAQPTSVAPNHFAMAELVADMARL